MGQYWTFLNIDKCQQLQGSKMGEFFFEEDLPPTVIRWLAVPEGQTLAEHHNKDPASWAGDRIICIGDYTQDWPPNILSARDCQKLEPPHFLWCRAFSVYGTRSDPLPGYKGVGVLRNLSKKIYVQSIGLPTVNEKRNGLCMSRSPGPLVDESLGLCTVLLSRIGWSEDPGVSISWEDSDSLAAGEWAGDRFDVRAYDDVKEELESGGWIDVTDQEAKRITSIWESEFEHLLRGDDED